MALATRKPTGLAPWPFVLIEGAEKTGKSFTIALASADHRLGRVLWLDCGEGAADQYGALPGARYEVVDHDGSYRAIKAQVEEVVKLPGVDADGKPTVFVFDSATNLWSMLKDEAQAEANARAARKGRRGDADAQVTMDLWNRARDRWKATVDPLIAWPGLVVFTARGKEVAALDESGRPIQGSKTYTVEAHRTLTFDVDVLLRTVRPGIVRLTGARSAHDLRSTLDKDSKGGLPHILFDVLKLGTAPAGTRDLKVAPAQTIDEEELAGFHARIDAAGGDKDALRAIWHELNNSGRMTDELNARIKAAGEKTTQAEAAAKLLDDMAGEKDAA